MKLPWSGKRDSRGRRIYIRTKAFRRFLSIRLTGVPRKMPEDWGQRVSVAGFKRWEKELGPRLLCACGCGNYPKCRGRKYCDGHVPWGQHRKGVPSWNKGRAVPQEQREKIREKLLGRKLSEEHKNCIKVAMHRPEVQRKLRVSKPWLKGNRHNMKAMLEGRIKIRSYPTSLERKMAALLEKVYPKQWKYIGHGGTIIGGKIPDFVNINGYKAVIEVFGRYWHRPEDELTRSKHFAKYGFCTLVIWEEDLQHEKRVKKKLREFINALKR